jgi:hypothetical protein
MYKSLSVSTTIERFEQSLCQSILASTNEGAALLGKQAKILSEDDLQDLLAYASATRNSLRNQVIVLLSAKAGLRAAEIAAQ